MGFFANRIKELDQTRPAWEPKFPEFASGGNNFKLRPLDNESGTTPWVPAPATSHLLAFRYLPASKQSKFAREKLGGGQSYIFIRFRGKGRRPVTEYRYTYADEAEADAVWSLLTEAPHPGEVVLYIMIQDQTPYLRVS